MTKKLWRGVVALATACTCLVATTTPAGAVTWTTNIGSGTGDLTKTGQPTRFVSFTTTGTTGCSRDADVDINVPSGSQGTFAISAMTYLGRTQPFSTGTPYYIMEVTRLGGASGSGDDTNSAITGVGLSLNIRFWLANDQSATATSCSVTGTTLANWTTTLTLSGTYVFGVLRSPGFLDIASLSSTAATPLVGTATPPFATYTLGSFSVTGLSLHLTTSP